MANRLVLGALPGGGQGLRVSTPGNNVLSTGLQGRNVAFDSRWLGSSRIVTMGSSSIPASGSTTVNFGVTLPEPPTVIAMTRSTSTGRYVVAGYGNVGIIFSGVWDDASEVNPRLDYTQQNGVMSIYNNRFVIHANPDYSLYNVMHYIVLG